MRSSLLSGLVTLALTLSVASCAEEAGQSAEKPPVEVATEEEVTTTTEAPTSTLDPFIPWLLTNESDLQGFNSFVVQVSEDVGNAMTAGDVGQVLALCDRFNGTMRSEWSGMASIYREAPDSQMASAGGQIVDGMTGMLSSCLSLDIETMLVHVENVTDGLQRSTARVKHHTPS